MKHRTPRRGQEEHRISVFTVDLKNQPGELARLCEAMAGRGISLVLSATARGEQGTVVFIADDEASAGTELQDADIQYTMRPALTIWLTSCRASRMTRPRSCRGWEPSGGPDAAAGPGHRRLPRASAGPDRGPVRHYACITAKARDMLLTEVAGKASEADAARPGRCGKAQSDALLARHGFCALAGAARCATCHPAPA